MGMLKEFKEFAVKGNVIDLAIGVIIGGAFGKIVTSIVEDVLTPAILNPTLKAAGVAKLEDWSVNGMLLGKFLAAVISFIFIALVLFIIVKGINASNRKKEEVAPPAATPEDIQLLREIRDALKK
jgi:large conductance mechanosensitive channel